MAVLTQTEEYALRTALYLARRYGERPARVNELAAALGIPRNYLSKTLHLLGRAGVLTSPRGRLGGCQLSRPPEQFRLVTVLEPFGHVSGNRRCLLGNEVCSDRTACDAHQRWKSVSESVEGFFRETTLSELLQQVEPAP